MNSTKFNFKISLVMCFLLLLTSIGASDSVKNFDLSFDKEEVVVPGTVQITGEISGSDLNSAQIERWKGTGWNSVGEVEDCYGDKCDFVRTYGRSRTGEVAFRIKAATDDGNIETSSRKTVNFVKGSGGGGKDPRINSVEISVNKNRVKVPGIVRVNSKVSAENLENLKIEKKRRYSNWDTVGEVEDCSGNHCSIQRTYGTSNTGTVIFRAEATDQDGNKRRSVKKHVEFFSRKPSDNIDPNAVLDISPNNADTGEKIRFDARSSTDNKKIDRYKFDFDGDGDYDETNREGIAHKRFFSEISARGKVKVIDRAGNSDTDSEHFQVRTRERDRNTGSLRVTVQDRDFERLENALVTVNNGDKKTDRTDSSGRTRKFSNLETQKYYSVKVECDGEKESRSVYIPGTGTKQFEVKMDQRSSDNVCDDQDQGEKPEAFFTVSDLNPSIGQSVRFDASGTTGSIAEYRWDFPTATKFGEVVHHSFSSSGTKTVRLRATNFQNNPDSFERTINVKKRKGDLEQCGVSLKDLTLEDSSIGIDEETEASFSVSNTGDKQEIRVQLFLGSTDLINKKITLSSGESRDFSKTLSSDQDAEVRAKIKTTGEPCGSQVFETTEELTVEDEEQNGSLTVSVEDGGSDELEDVSVEVENGETRSSETDSNGEVKFSNLEADSYDVTAECDGEEVEDSVQISEGEEEQLDLEFQKDFENDDCDEQDEDDGGVEADLEINPDSARTGQEIEFDASGSTADEEIEEYEFDLDDDGDYEVETEDSRIERTFFNSRDTGATVRVTDEDGDSDTASADYEVRQDGRIEFSNVNAPQSVCRGESFNVEMDVRNRGERQRLVDVTGTGAGSSSYSAFLDEDESRRISLSFTPTSTGQKTITVDTRSGNSDTVTRNVQVVSCQQEDRSQVSGISVDVTPKSVRAGESVKISGYVDDADGRRSVRIQLDGETVADISTQPDGYYQTFITPESVGERNVFVSSSGKNARRTLEVLPSVEVINVEAPQKIFQGESFDVCGRVETQQDILVMLLREGERLESRYDSGRVCFETKSSEVGKKEYTIQAISKGLSRSASKKVEIMETKPETRSFPGKVASVESGRGIVKATLYNTHREQRRYMVDIEGLPSTWTSTTQKEVVLQPGEQREVFFYLTPREEGRFDAEVRVRSRGNLIYSDTVELEVGGSKSQKKSFLEKVVPFL